MEWLRQVHMERKIGISTTENMIGWIEEKFAKVGKKLKFQDDNTDDWQPGWTVTTVGGRRTRVEQQDRSQDCKRQRKGSDI